MLGHVLCWFGWHDWGYRAKLPRRLMRHINTAWDTEYRCVRCGVQP